MNHRPRVVPTKSEAFMNAVRTLEESGVSLDGDRLATYKLFFDLGSSYRAARRVGIRAGTPWAWVRQRMIAMDWPESLKRRLPAWRTAET